LYSNISVQISCSSSNLSGESSNPNHEQVEFYSSTAKHLV